MNTLKSFNAAQAWKTTQAAWLDEIEKILNLIQEKAKAKETTLVLEYKMNQILKRILIEEYGFNVSYHYLTDKILTEIRW
jgi:hypothetical protein